jgi:hypothetical protein
MNWAHIGHNALILNIKIMVGAVGIEPTTPAV